LNEKVKEYWMLLIRYCRC